MTRSYQLSDQSVKKLSNFLANPKYQPPKRRRSQDFPVPDEATGLDIQQVTFASDSHITPYSVPYGSQPAPYPMSPSVLSGRTGSKATQLPVTYSNRISLTLDEATDVDPLVIINPSNYIWHYGDKGLILQSRFSGFWEVISVQHQYADRILFRLTSDSASGYNIGQSPPWAYFGSMPRALVGEALGPAAPVSNGELPIGSLILWDIYYKFPNAKRNDVGIASWSYRDKRWEIEECTHAATRLRGEPAYDPYNVGPPTDRPMWVKVYAQTGFDGRHPNIQATGNAVNPGPNNYQFYAKNVFGFTWQKIFAGGRLEMMWDFFEGVYYILQTQESTNFTSNTGPNPNLPVTEA